MKNLNPKRGCKTCDWWLEKKIKEGSGLGPFYINVEGHYTISELMESLKRDFDLYGDLPVTFFKGGESFSFNFSHPQKKRRVFKFCGKCEEMYEEGTHHNCLRLSSVNY